MNQVRLGQLAHARAGDKGDSSILCVFPYERSDLERVASAMSTEVIAQHFSVSPEAVTVTVASDLGALTVVVRGALEGGVTRSPHADPHGKTLSGHLLDLELQLP